MGKKKEETALTVGLTTEAENLIALLKRTDTENPKQADINALRQVLNDIPELWHNLGGNLSRRAMERIVESFTKQTNFREAIQHGIDAQRKSLGWKDADMLEKLLIENVLLTMTGFNDVQMRYINVRDGGQGLSFEAGLYWEKRLTAAQRRYLKACETLAKVRRLNKTPVQINIADNQVNIATGAAPPDSMQLAKPKLD